ncbi:MAG: hypothetical protein K6E13_10340 [Lachnospiraceae bacterium]|nr:hypothetical protein [Lachnospiraceae bacterium]
MSRYISITESKTYYFCFYSCSSDGYTCTTSFDITYYPQSGTITTGEGTYQLFSAPSYTGSDYTWLKYKAGNNQYVDLYFYSLEKLGYTSPYYIVIADKNKKIYKKMPKGTYYLKIQKYSNKTPGSGLYTITWQ